jgi:hypothetical protein
VRVLFPLPSGVDDDRTHVDAHALAVELVKRPEQGLNAITARVFITPLAVRNQGATSGATCERKIARKSLPFRALKRPRSVEMWGFAARSRAILAANAGLRPRGRPRRLSLETSSKQFTAPA